MYFREIIFGYKNLKINYYLLCGSLETFISIEYSNKFNPLNFNLDTDHDDDNTKYKVYYYLNNNQI